MKVTKAAVVLGLLLAFLAPPVAAVEITDSHFSVRESNGGSYVIVVGELRNESGSKVENIVVEAKFFDADGKLVDASTETLYNVSVPANDEVAFRLQFFAAVDAATYARHELRVLSEFSYGSIGAGWSGDGDEGDNLFLELLISSFPILLLIAVWILFVRRWTGKNSAQARTLDLIEKQNNLMTEQNAALQDIAKSLKERR